MEIVLLLIVIVLIFVIKSSISDVTHQQKNILHALQQLQEELTETKRTVNQLKLKVTLPSESSVEKTTIKENLNATEKSPDFVPLYKKQFDTVINEQKKINPTQVEIDKITVIDDVVDSINSKNYSDSPIDSTVNKPSFWENFIQKNPDIEKFIGENLINKVGITVLVLGIAFFIKYAIDKNWINEIGRVAIGLFCGIFLISVAHYLRNTYRSFSSVLVGGGLTVLYFSIGFAFQQYQMFSQTAAFVLVCLITTLAILLCIFYNRIELGIIATIGGFATPFIVSTGSGNYVVLFTYLCVLNSGLIALAYFKNWRIVQFIAFIFTSIIYCTWLYNRIAINELPIKGALFFATIFYILFVAMNLLHHIVKKFILKASDFTLLLSINSCFFISGINILEQSKSTNYSGLFTTLLAILNGIIVGWIYLKKDVDKNLLHLFIGITTTYFSLIAPIHFDGADIVIFWSAQMVVLLWLYQKSSIRLLKIATLILAAIVVGSLILNLDGYNSFTNTVSVILNKQFITYFFASICFTAFYWLLKKEANTYFEFSITTSMVKKTVLAIALIILFASGFREINYQINARFAIANASLICLNFYLTAFVLCLLKVFKNDIVFTKNMDCLISISIVLLFKLLSWIFIRNNIENAIITHQSQWQLVVFFCSEAALYLLFLYAIKNFKKIDDKNGIKNYTSFYSIALVLNISSTLLIFYLLIAQPNIDNIEHYNDIYNRAGLSILWGVLSFIAMWLGMKWANKTLRVFALVLFGITLIKLAVIDIQRMNEAGKIIAFILLGAILLIVSFMYQKLKKLINNDTE